MVTIMWSYQHWHVVQPHIYSMSHREVSSACDNCVILSKELIYSTFVRCLCVMEKCYDKYF
jgi:hypothetical protein